jgi:four helix bundle protein
MSVAANYRASQMARSKKEFIAKLGVVLEEADETFFWLELVVESQMLPAKKVALLRNEAHELVAIFTASVKNAKATPTRGTADESTN